MYPNKKREYPNQYEEEECPTVLDITNGKEQHFLVPVGTVGKYTLYLAFRNQQECQASGLVPELHIDGWEVIKEQQWV